MLSRLAYGLYAWRRRVALIPMFAVVALATAQSASASTPLTGEVLSGTGTTSNGSCHQGVSGKASFSVSGPATGPYPGMFVASGSAWVSGLNQHGIGAPASESGTFTITSGTTTITGTFRPVSFGEHANVSYSCPTFGFYGLSIYYTAVINGQTYTGNGFAGRPADQFDTSPASHKNLATTNTSFTN
jgi:hypothetical protein